MLLISNQEGDICNNLVFFSSTAVIHNGKPYGQDAAYLEVSSFLKDSIENFCEVKRRNLSFFYFTCEPLKRIIKTARSRKHLDSCLNTPK